ncbi:AAA family ATPase [Runella salmonicolor]|uniref:AAA family ATPase n=1 Tax=Runella salmonicolor TaxID=2950278 RepID=A0ABT1FS63_9BACT|nr:AAA family ATPase [Runella salmonicolor]MCP1384600.1 AAA family ATPase [Runella salmonicolor]
MEFRPVTKKGATKENVAPASPSKVGLLVVKTANQTIEDAKLQAIPNALCGNFWYEGEVSILFADTNVGKSILSVQIADMISRGDARGVFGCQAKAQYILYLDFELSDKQFEKRYSVDYQKHYLWDKRFLRVKINTAFTDFDDFEKQLFFEIENLLVETSIKILVVDNITYLKMQSTESGKEAMPLMKHLTRLKHQFGLSLLVIAHTPKRLNPSSPLTFNDLAGSKQLSNFADSIFCIGRSNQEPDLRYVKQLKARSCAVSEEVWVCRLEKQHNFLGFNFLETNFEQNHLKPKNEAKNELMEQVSKLRDDHPDWPYQKIADEAGTNKMNVKRILDRLKL